MSRLLKYLCWTAIVSCTLMFTIHRFQSSELGFITPERLAKMKTLEKYLEGVQNSTLKRRLPDAIIIGAPKCGTGALIRFLNETPLIRAPSKAETFFFVGDDVSNIGYYRSLFPMVKDYEVVMEKTPAYVRFHQIPFRIKKMLPKAKVILLLCNPVNRTYSDFVQQVLRKEIPRQTNFDNFVAEAIKELEENMKLSEIDHVGNLLKIEKILHLRIVTTGMYYVYVKHWLQWYKLNENFLILDGEEFLQKPWIALNEVERFLNIPNITTKEDFEQLPSGFFCMKKWEKETSLECMPKFKGRTRMTNAEWNPEPLSRFFESYNEKLFALISRRFEWH